MENLLQEPKYLEEKLLVSWKKILKTERIRLNDPFFALGGDSLMALQLSQVIQKTFAIPFPVEKIFSLTTIRAQSEYISQLCKQESSPFIFQLQAGEKTPLVLLHPLGGSLFSFMPLMKGVEKNRTIIGIQDPFFSGSLRFYPSIEKMAEHYIEQLDLLFPNETLILAGYSLGGTVAFEMSRQLLEKGRKVLYLFIIDSWAKLPFDTSIRDQLQHIVQQQSERIKAFMGKDFVLNEPHWLEVMQNRIEILIHYAAQHAKVKLALFTPQEILPAFAKNNFTDNAWSSHVDEITVTQTPGNHGNMMEEGNVGVIRNFMQAILQQLP